MSQLRKSSRALLQLARYGTTDKPRRVVPKISQKTLSSVIGSSRSRVNVVMNKFKRLSFIDYNGTVEDGVTINHALLSVVLHD